ncbi:hypothetical protein KC343_g106 [Hortaea werneckii]|nr:hypothetical protein KC352_g1248 [Hortaea werneckii]KAI7307087.1 hypothetical protein KC340_g11537 [Hortaea werneckii]KAI7382868.1 hypothetical protein KC328_g11553 [Hortaea werneckii]KAI7573187.1 hypothetical protein KC317_g92 [Hortaea werneckii]KAI7628599.1 hypothetical protein KC346_g97 [Hortaea werneckii]
MNSLNSRGISMLYEELLEKPLMHLTISAEKEPSQRREDSPTTKSEPNGLWRIELMLPSKGGSNKLETLEVSRAVLMAMPLLAQWIASLLNFMFAEAMVKYLESGSTAILASSLKQLCTANAAVSGLSAQTIFMLKDTFLRKVYAKY